MLEEQNKNHLDENAHTNGTNQSADIDGRVNLPAAAGSIRRQEADERDGDESVDLIGPHLLAEAELLLQEHDEDEQGRDERRGVATKNALRRASWGPPLRIASPDCGRPRRGPRSRPAR